MVLDLPIQFSAFSDLALAWELDMRRERRQDGGNSVRVES